MASFEIRGGKPLHGTLVPQGAKNEALQIICATLLTKDKVRVDNVPDIHDINRLIELLQGMGTKVERTGEGTYTFETETVDFNYLQSSEFLKKAGSLRGSIMMVGPLLARFRKGTVARPGGDKIGRRKLDVHFEGLMRLGAEFTYDEASGLYHARTKGMKGCSMLLEEASVTGTANIVMAAVLAEGTTTIFNAACEPYLHQLCSMLNRMGARISGVGSNLLTIEGVDSLHGCEHRLLPDMIEIGSFIGMAAITQSDITIKQVGFEHLGLIPKVFERLGIQMERQGDDLHIPKQEHYEVDTFMDGSILTIADAPWPGFTPDLISIALVTAIQAKGSVLIHQKMFESRLFFVDKLIDMGAQIILCDPHRATIIGLDHRTALKSAVMTSPDIRAGVALLIAALSAKGKSVIHNIEQIDRGYQHIDTRLNAIGADIRRTD
ncbi:MAG: UDP-N-acetylglucosamine 1-carboxyvinyltransferase [Bacteroidales bacterium]|nr:UDP-N-acetylglucosamine 1-carboxyvinyltransferase [Bacteroidales bacterium]